MLQGIVFLLILCGPAIAGLSILIGMAIIDIQYKRGEKRKRYGKVRS